MEVQKRLAAYMRDHGIKQQFVAKETGIAQSKLSYILNGQLMLKADDLEKILKVLNLDPNEVIKIK